MFDDWKDFNKEKPSVYQTAKMAFSKQCLFIIDEKMYMGVYVCPRNSSDTFIELCRYELNAAQKLYQNEDRVFISQNDFDKHEIFWHNLDLISFLCHIDLLKQER